MKKENNFDSGFYYALLGLSFCLPFYSFFTNVFLVVLLLFWLVQTVFFRKLRLTEAPAFSSYLSFFLLHCFSLLHTENLPIGLFNVEKKLPLLLLAVSIATFPASLSKIKIQNILFAFVIGCFLVSLACLLRGAYKYVIYSTTDFLTYEGLIDWTGLQPTYFAIYVTFAQAILLNFLMDVSNIKHKSLIVWLVAYLFFFSVLVAARTPLFIQALILAIGGVSFALRNKRMKSFAIVVILLVSLASLTIFNNEFLKERVTSLVGTKFKFNPQENNANGLTLRLVKWECSINGLLTNPLFGVGIGDMQDYLQDCYKDKNFWGQVFEFNSHNQYLQTSLGLGFLGLVSILVCLVMQVKIAFERRDFVFLAFIVIVSISFLTESVLERKQGVVFYGFFSALLSFYPIKKESARLKTESNLN